MLTVAVVIALSALVQGLSGFGFGMLAIALLSPLIGYRDAMGLLVVLNVFINLCNFAFHGVRFSWKGTGGVIGGLLVGVPVGMFCVTVLNEHVLFILLGLFLAYSAGTVLWSKARGRPVAGPGRGWVAGGLSGFFGGGFNAGGPPMVNYCFRGEESFFACKQRFAALVFLMSIYRFALAGPVGLEMPVSWSWVALLCGVVLASFTVGFVLSRKVSGELMKTVVYSFLLLLGVVFVVKHLTPWVTL